MDPEGIKKERMRKDLIRSERTKAAPITTNRSMKNATNTFLLFRGRLFPLLSLFFLGRIGSPSDSSSLTLSVSP